MFHLSMAKSSAPMLGANIPWVLVCTTSDPTPIEYLAIGPADMPIADSNTTRALGTRSDM